MAVAVKVPAPTTVAMIPERMLLALRSIACTVPALSEPTSFVSSPNKGDSLLERGGFEPSVPPQQRNGVSGPLRTSAIAAENASNWPALVTVTRIRGPTAAFYRDAVSARNL